ncbi:MAG: methyltransferase domain-containing protein [Vicinamibacterales bacterium]
MTHVHTSDDTAKWRAYQESVAGRLRTELLWRGLEPHLPPPPASVVDIGAGTGDFAERLVHAGYRASLVDVSAAMLAEAAARLGRADVRTVVGDIEHDELELAPSSVDIVVCHSVIEFVEDRERVAERLVGWLRPGGVLSLAFGNRQQGPLKAALVSRDFARARRELEGPPETPDCFGRPRRLLDPDAGRRLLARPDLSVVDELGIRCVLDLLGDGVQEDALAALVALEIDLMRRPEYRCLARYVQLVARCRP